MDNTQIEVDWSPAQFGQYNSRPMVSHGELRGFEQAFPSVMYSDGVPFVPWRTFERKMTHGSGGLDVVVRNYFPGKRLLSNASGVRKAVGPVPIERSIATYLRLEHAILATQMKRFVGFLYAEWHRNRRALALAVREYPSFQGTHKPGVCMKNLKKQLLVSTSWDLGLLKSKDEKKNKKSVTQGQRSSQMNREVHIWESANAN